MQRFLSDPNYWNYYGNYQYGQDPSQYFAAAAAAYGSWTPDGMTWPAAPTFQPPPPSQPPPPPPPEDDVPPPPPGVPSSDSAQPSPKRPKTSSDHKDKLPTDLPPPPPGSMPNFTTPKPSADKDKCGYYDSTTDTASWDTSSAWGSGQSVTRTFAQVVSGAKSEQSDDRTGNDFVINFRIFVILHTTTCTFHSSK